MSALLLHRLLTITITTIITIKNPAVKKKYEVCHQGEYGEKGIGSFIQLATKSGICIGVSITINRNAANQEFLKVLFLEDMGASSSTKSSSIISQVVDTLLSNRKARAVILFVDEDKTR